MDSALPSSNEGKRSRFTKQRLVLNMVGNILINVVFLQECEQHRWNPNPKTFMMSFGQIIESTSIIRTMCRSGTGNSLSPIKYIITNKKKYTIKYSHGRGECLQVTTESRRIPPRLDALGDTFEVKHHHLISSQAKVRSAYVTMNDT